MAMWNICRNCGCDWLNHRTGSCITDTCENYTAGIGVNMNLTPTLCGCTNWQPISRQERNALRQYDREHV